MRCKTSGAQQFQIAFESSLTQKATVVGWSILALRWNYGDRFRRAVVTKQRKRNIHDLPHSNEHNIHLHQCLSRAQSTDCTRLELNRWRWVITTCPGTHSDGSRTTDQCFGWIEIAIHNGICLRQGTLILLYSVLYFPLAQLSWISIPL